MMRCPPTDDVGLAPVLFAIAVIFGVIYWPAWLNNHVGELNEREEVFKERIRKSKMVSVKYGIDQVGYQICVFTLQDSQGKEFLARFSLGTEEYKVCEKVDTETKISSSVFISSRFQDNPLTNEKECISLFFQERGVGRWEF
jgi:hypothetical protein